MNKKQVVSRFYNQISFSGNKVIKGVPKDRFEKETRWFKEAQKIIPDNIPRIYSCNGKVNRPDKSNLSYYEMQAIDGDNLYQWVIMNKEHSTEMFDKLIELAKKLHHKTSNPNKDDIFSMYYLKPKRALIEFFDKSNMNTATIFINGCKFSNPIKQLENIYKYLEKRLLNTRFAFIHGDMTMSNVVVSSDKKLYLIDPRGCFGNTDFYGDVRYDIAKIYYSIVGNFDSLNNGKFTYKKEAGTTSSHSYSITDNGLSGYSKSIIEKFGEQHDVIKYIHATIWLSLIPHVANNLNQQYCTFCHGIYLLNTINDYDEI
ncbi:aminoglycoside phosphotransferase family protein [Patescibacteria group bacterium]|nr:aminoglycoside phosphotransferase family protein [Patescibacteria group bacterium]